MDQFWSITLQLLEGFKENCDLFGVTLIAALPLGLIISFGSMSSFKPLRFFTRTIVWIIRGTPLLLQLFVVWYIPPLLSEPLSGLLSDWTGSHVEIMIRCDDRMTAAMIAFVINYSAYFSEIYRGGIESIPKGQYEAGYVLGMKKSQIFFKIVLLQVIKRIVAPMSNEIITLVKDTSLARVIAVAEILKNAERFTKQGLIWPIFYTGAFFLLFCGALTLLFRFIEKKLDYYNG